MQQFGYMLIYCMSNDSNGSQRYSDEWKKSFSGGYKLYDFLSVAFWKKTKCSINNRLVVSRSHRIVLTTKREHKGIFWSDDIFSISIMLLIVWNYVLKFIELETKEKEFCFTASKFQKLTKTNLFILFLRL